MRVLIIEDNQDAADSLQVFLGLFGNDVRVAYDGVEGVRLALEFQPEVVLSDIGLPGLDGFGVARALRDSGARLIAITAYGEEEYVRRAEESGFSLLLVKPADPNRLVKLLAGGR